MKNVREMMRTMKLVTLKKRCSKIVLLLLLPSFVCGQATELVDVVATGIGVDKSEAQVAALRNAIEQAFGAFISSKTEILNDELVKDEVVSVSNGNIQSFEEIAFIVLESGEYMTTLKASVSLSSLATFVRAKGYAEVSFNGSGFAMDIKIKKQNAEAERIAINNILQVGLQLCENFYQPIISVSEPYAINSEHYAVPLTMKLKSTQQWSDFLDYMIASFEGIELKSSELSGYDKVNLDYYKFNTLRPKRKWSKKNRIVEGYTYLSTHYFRNRESLDLIRAFFLTVNVRSIITPKITNGLEVISIGFMEEDKYNLAQFNSSDDWCRKYNRWCLIFENGYCKRMLFDATEYSDTALIFVRAIKRKDRINGKYYERVYDTLNIHPNCNSHFIGYSDLVNELSNLLTVDYTNRNYYGNSVSKMFIEETDLSSFGGPGRNDWNEFNYWFTPDNLLRFDIELTYKLDELAKISAFKLVE